MSKRIIGNEAVKNVTSSLTVPDMAEIAEKVLQELRDLTISQVEWFGCLKFGVTLSDGQSCYSGEYNFS